MASKNSHNAAFMTGTVLGGLVGAAVALWKTPYSGKELREKMTGGAGDEVTIETVATGRLPEPTLKDRVLSTAEELLAPVVGVKLGKTANDSGMADTATSPVVTTEPPAGTHSPAGTPDLSDAAMKEPPAAPGYTGGGEQSPNPDKDTIEDFGAVRTGNEANVTPVDESAEVPDRTSSTSVEPASEPATVEDLTTPQTHELPDALKHEEHEMQPFPKLGGSEKGGSGA